MHKFFQQVESLGPNDPTMSHHWFFLTKINGKKDIRRLFSQEYVQYNHHQNLTKIRRETEVRDEYIRNWMPELWQPVCCHVCLPKYMSDRNLNVFLKPWLDVFNNISNLPGNMILALKRLDYKQIVAFNADLGINRLYTN